MEIDLNADVGEARANAAPGEDEALIPLVTSVNIACGFHAGDPRTMDQTVGLAVRSGASIGAHPGYPDLAGFGRRDLEMSPEDIEAAVVYQVGALLAFVRAAGAELRHVKPHGALYNRAVVDRGVATAVARGVRRSGTGLRLIGLAGSALLDAARDEGLPVAVEAFPDRVYEPDGRLRSRTRDDALVADPAAVARRAVRLAVTGEVDAIDGTVLRIRPDSLCIHGDEPGAARRARATREALAAAGVRVRALP